MNGGEENTDWGQNEGPTVSDIRRAALFCLTGWMGDSGRSCHLQLAWRWVCSGFAGGLGRVEGCVGATVFGKRAGVLAFVGWYGSYSQSGIQMGKPTGMSSSSLNAIFIRMQSFCVRYGEGTVLVFDHHPLHRTELTRRSRPSPSSCPPSRH
jgi:hypothetical protein